MTSMNIITKNSAGTVGVVSNVEGLKNVGEFKIKNLEDWIKMVKTVLGDDADILIQFKLSEDPKTPGYMITACHEEMDPMVATCGTYCDGVQWGEPEKKPAEKPAPKKAK
jgi:hypothetical protein